MARGGGGRRRAYTRDANGRFSSTPGGGGLGALRKKATPTPKKSKAATQIKGGTLAARSSLKASRSKLAAMAKPTGAQKGAVTRGETALKAAKASSQKRMAFGIKNTVSKPKELKPGALAARRAVSIQAPQKAMSTPKGTSSANSIKRNRFLDPIARQILIATGQISRKKKR